MTRYEVTPRERLLRVLLAASSLLLVAWVASLFPYLPAVLVTILYVGGGIAGGCAAAFYAVWTLGWLLDGDGDTRLLGDGSFDPPRPYFPWMPWVAAERRSRRIAALERDVGLGPDGRFYHRQRVADPLELAIAQAMGTPITDAAPLPVRAPFWSGIEFAPLEKLPADRPPTDAEWQATFGKTDEDT